MASSKTGPLSRSSLVALVVGVVLLGLLVFFAVGLPKLIGGDEGESAAGGAGVAGSLPDSLPGGWQALEDSSGPDGGDAAAYSQQQKTAIAYVNKVYRQVYDEGTQFRAYVNEEKQALVTTTVFDAAGGAFAPANGVADPALLKLDRAPVELTRNGDAVCIASYQSAAQTTGSSTDDAAPLSVSCQMPHGASTLQIGAQGLSVAETAALLGELDKALA